MSKLKLINASSNIQDATEQYLMAQDRYSEQPTTETYANLLRAAMVVNTKKIALSPEEMEELRAMKQNAKEPA